MTLTLLADNTGVIELRGVKNTVTGELDTTASLTLDIVDAQGVRPVGFTPLSMAHVGAGTYRAVLEDPSMFRAQRRYTAKASGTGSAGEVLSRQCPLYFKTPC